MKKTAIIVTLAGLTLTGCDAEVSSVASLQQQINPPERSTGSQVLSGMSNDVYISPMTSYVTEIYSDPQDAVMKALPGIGNRREELASILKHSYNILSDENLAAHYSVASAALHDDCMRIVALFPEDSNIRQKKEQVTNPNPYTVMFIEHLIDGIYGNAFMQISRGYTNHPAVQQAKQLFREYYQVLANPNIH